MPQSPKKTSHTDTRRPKHPEKPGHGMQEYMNTEGREVLEKRQAIGLMLSDFGCHCFYYGYNYDY